MWMETYNRTTIEQKQKHKNNKKSTLFVKILDRLFQHFTLNTQNECHFICTEPLHMDFSALLRALQAAADSHNSEKWVL